MKNIKNVFLLLTALLTFTNTAIAGVEEDVSQLQKSWEKVKYQSPPHSMKKDLNL